MGVQTLAQNRGVLISEAPSPWSSPHEGCARARILASRVPSSQPPKCPRQYGSRGPARWEPPRLGPPLQEHSVAPAWGFPTFRGQQAWHGTALRVAELLTPPPERDCQPQSLHLGKRGSEEEVASSTTFSLQIQTSPRGRGGPRGKAGTGQPSPPAGGTPGNLLPAESLMCLAASSLLRHPRSSLHVGSFVAAHRL